MDLYKELAHRRCVTRSDIEHITGSENAAAWHIRSLLQKGYIERVRHDLYAVISLETDQPIANRYQIASATAEDAYVSHHSAFEYHGVANQVYHEVYFSSQKRLRSFSYDGLNYTYIPSHSTVGIVEDPTGVRVTNLERTVIDSIKSIDKITDLEELLRCISLIPYLSPDKLLEVLADYENGKLYQKTGYLLEHFQDELSLPESFFAECEDNSNNSKTYFSKARQGFVYHKRWKLYAPADPKKIMNKGIPSPLLEPLGSDTNETQVGEEERP